MTYAEQNDQVTLTMSRDDYHQLLIYFGFVAAAMEVKEGPASFYEVLSFVNKLNTGNPHFTPYEIPAEYAPKHADADATIQ